MCERNMKFVAFSQFYLVTHSKQLDQIDLFLVTIYETKLFHCFDTFLLIIIVETTRNDSYKWRK